MCIRDRRVGIEDRRDVVAALWEIALSDGQRSAEEESLVRLVSGLLGVNDRDSALVRRQINGQLGLSSD